MDGAASIDGEYDLPSLLHFSDLTGLPRAQRLPLAHCTLKYKNPASFRVARSKSLRRSHPIYPSSQSPLASLPAHQPKAQVYQAREPYPTCSAPSAVQSPRFNSTSFLPPSSRPADRRLPSSYLCFNIFFFVENPSPPPPPPPRRNIARGPLAVCFIRFSSGVRYSLVASLLNLPLI